jgi:hypothetical protein
MGPIPPVAGTTDAGQYRRRRIAVNVASVGGVPNTPRGCVIREMDAMDRYANEIEQLRGLGFAEGLPIGGKERSPGLIARLECGWVGVAVEFFEPKPVPTYAVIALDAASADVAPIHRWDDVVRDIHQRMPPNDD